MWEEPLALPRPSLDARDFRSALGGFPTGVCLITTLAPDASRVGLTANSFSSVSLEPPMVLWSLARTASCAPVFRDAEYFAINVLAADDEELSSHFAKSGADKFLKCLCCRVRWRPSSATAVTATTAATTSSSSASSSATRIPTPRRSSSIAAATAPADYFAVAPSSAGSPSVRQSTVFDATPSNEERLV